MDCFLNLFLSVLLILGAVWVAGRYFLREDVVYIPDGKRRHEWKSIKFQNRPCFCSICENLMSSNGVFCENCGICSDNGCIRKADTEFRCKELRIRSRADDGKESRHLWVKGNLPLGSECCVCAEDIDQSSEPGLFAQRCAWCQRSAHDKCFSEVSKTLCDFGEFKSMIFPPKCILASRSKGAPKVHLTGIIPPEWKDQWKPLIVVGKCVSRERKIFVILMILLILQLIPSLEAVAPWKLWHRCVESCIRCRCLSWSRTVPRKRFSGRSTRPRPPVAFWWPEVMALLAGS